MTPTRVISTGRESLHDGKSLTCEELYDRFGAEIFRYIRSWFPYDRDTAEDILQEVFIRAWKKSGTIREPDRVRSWLYRIASSLSANWKRDRKTHERYLKAGAANERRGSQNPVEKTATDRELFRILSEEVASLPDFERQVFILRGFQEMGYDAIVRITQTTMNRVKKAMNRAVRKLADRLRKRNVTIPVFGCD